MKLDPPSTLSEQPIPDDVRPTRRWTSQMREIADHIGPRATLLLIERLGGQKIYVPEDPSRGGLADIIGDAAAGTMARVFGRNELQLPVGKAALNEAKRAGIIAAIRAKKMTIAEAVPIVGTSRTYLSHLVNHSDEGEGSTPVLPSRRVDSRQIDMFTHPSRSDSGH